jgi:hypothetical protein
MSGSLQVALLILGVAGILLLALRYGCIGGGGGVTYRKDHPIAFWIGVVLNTFILAAALLVFVGSFISPARFDLG